LQDVFQQAASEDLDMTFDPAAVRRVASMAEVRARHPEPMSRASGKVLTRLDAHCRAILARATFCVLGTRGPGGADVSPRGDPAGFIRVLDERHLLLPDRIGNNRFDSYDNIFHEPQVGLLILVPGMAETLRINGLACVIDDERVLAGSAVQGRTPQVGLLIEVREAYLHCAKSINRAGLWDASRHINRDDLPSYGQMLADHVAGLTAEESARQGEEMARRGLY
jgi:PPOX class probable FMN-dependent enzyme